MDTFYLGYDGIIWGGLLIALFAASVNALAADDPHRGVAPATGGFFLAAALAQGLYAGALLRAPSKPLYLAGIWINLALVALYVAARTPGRYTPCKRWTCPVWPPNWP